MVLDFAFFFINYILPYVPSRNVRMFFYRLLSSGNISRSSTIGLGVKILNVRNVHIGNNSNINFGCILDGRGAAVFIGENVDIAPQVNIWTLQHDIKSESHASTGAQVTIEKGAWICNRVIILPGSYIGSEAVVGAGVSFKGNLDSNNVIVSGTNRVLDKKRFLTSDFTLKTIRRFR